ncbi:MAG: AI-2E family transporter [Gammaproteobacteria bacterium]|nr:AI-2E family transporter [Gammaproteobacteria bacterium]
MAFSLDQFYQLNRRALIWLVLFGLLWLMRDFFSLVFLTFVLAFVALRLAGFGPRYLRLPYRVSLVAVYLIFLAGLTGFVSYVTPNVIREATSLIGRLGDIQATLVGVKTGFVQRYPAMQRPLVGFLRSVLDAESRQRVDEKLSRETRSLGLDPGLIGKDLNGAELDPATAGSLARYNTLEEDLLLDSILAQQKVRIREYAPHAINLLYQGAVTTLLALLFSFLILIDHDRLVSQIRGLRASRLQDFYEEAAQPVVRFAYVVGRSIQAQALIALVNTALTATGLAFLGVPSLAVLSLIVFVCGFIPVLGTFISTTPIVLVALNAGGLEKAAAVVVLVSVVHLVEAYLLNPQIFGRHLNLNPVLVLIILFVGYHAFGIWGMVLGVPVTLYVLHDVFGVPMSYSAARVVDTPAC